MKEGNRERKNKRKKNEILTAIKHRVVLDALFLVVGRQMETCGADGSGGGGGVPSL